MVVVVWVWVCWYFCGSCGASAVVVEHAKRELSCRALEARLSFARRPFRGERELRLHVLLPARSRRRHRRLPGHGIGAQLRRAGIEHCVAQRQRRCRARRARGMLSVERAEQLNIKVTNANARLRAEEA